MNIESEKDFPLLREKIKQWRKQFSMFKHDIDNIEKVIEEHIKNYSNLLVNYRQTHKKNYLEQAEKELLAITKVVAMAEKMQLMSILSR
jgi:hypothetical protein